MHAGTHTVSITSAMAFIVGSALMASAAVADGPALSGLTLSVSSSSGGNMVFNPSDYGSSWSNPNGTFGFSGNLDGQGWNFGYTMMVGGGFDSDFIILNTVVTNTTDSVQTFTLTATKPFERDLPSLIGGSVGGSVTDLNGDGATVAALVGGSMYVANINGAAVAGSELLPPDQSSYSAGSFLSAVVGPATFGGEPIPQMLYNGGPITSIGITLSFTLTPGDSASFTSIFVVENVPGPGALALLGLAGLVGSRRRRA